MWVLVLLLLSSLTWAETSLNFDVKAKDGEDLKVRAFYYLNELGGEEVRLESASLPRINKRINSIYGHGRDLDDDGLIDTWFMIDPFEGIQILNEPCTDDACSGPILNRVFDNFHKSRKAMFYSAYASLVGYLFMSLDNRYSKEIDYYKELVNLEELRIRIEREMHSETPSLTKDQLRAGLEALIHGYEENQKMLDKAQGQNAWLLLGADVGLWVGGSIVYKALEKAAAKFMASAVYKNFDLYLNRFISAQSGHISKYMGKLKALRSSGTVATVATGRMTKELLQKTIRGGLMALKARGQMLNKLSPYKAKIMRPIEAGLSQWNYIILNGSVQLISEAFANYEEVKDKNPVRMAENVLTNPHIQQNITYMATETVLMSAAVATLQGTKARFAVCGVIALSNSAATNLLMRDKVNPERVVLDTGWEMAIGAAQVQLDIASLSYFEKLAIKNNNPKLKLLGYAVVVIDQGLGYFVYSKATNLVKDREKEKNNKQEEIKLMPVFAQVH